MNLDTRSPIRVGDKLRGYDGIPRASPSHDHTGILKEDTKMTKLKLIVSETFVSFVRFVVKTPLQ
jgi:hypothetical protein